MKPDYEKLFKALLVMNNYGIFLQTQNGHIYIEQDAERGINVLNRVQVNNKIYGGCIQAIETFDAAYQMDGNKPLAEVFDEWDTGGWSGLHLGKGGIDESRIETCADGEGGLV